MRVQFKSAATVFYEEYLAPIVDLVSVLPIDRARLKDRVYALQSPYLEMPVDPSDLTPELHRKFRERCDRLVGLVAMLPDPDVMPIAVLESIASFGKFLGLQVEQPGQLSAPTGQLSPQVPAHSELELETISAPTINEQMFSKLGTVPESKDWSADQFAAALGCSKGTIGETDAWRTIMALRGREKKERFGDKARKGRVNRKPIRPND